MGKVSAFCLSAVLSFLAMSFSAGAQSSGDLTQEAISAPTVREFLAVCAQGHEPCYEAMAMTLVTYGRADVICLSSPAPDSVYEAMFAWMKANSDIQQRDPFSGIILAAEAVYPCKK